MESQLINLATFSPTIKSGGIFPACLQKFIQENTVVVSSPGRINLIGEHTDYNNGFVLPAAVDKATYLAVTPRNDDEIHLYSLDMNEQYTTHIAKIKKSALSWPDYILGVVEQFKLAAVPLSGFDAALTGDIPIGAGMSSSAAVECATALALNELFAAGFDKLTLVKLAQKAENEFVGVQCGIMDQFASMMGLKNHLIKLDCRSLEYEYIPLYLKEHSILLFDTGVKHSLASSEYNTRRKECEQGVIALQKIYPHIRTLRDVNPFLINYLLKERVTDEIFRRCKYVVEENFRVQMACEDLLRNDIVSFGKKMFRTHEGLSRLYEVSCAELDYLISRAKADNRIVGARMMGGGFGGCTINIVQQNSLVEVCKEFKEAYRYEFGIELKTYPVALSGGTSAIKLYEHV